MHTINLLHVVNEFVDASVNTLILHIFKNLDRNVYRLHIGCVKLSPHNIGERFRDVGADVIWFADQPQGVRRAIAQYITAHHIDIVHTHVLRADLMGGFAARFHQRRPLVFSTRHSEGYGRKRPGELARSFLFWATLYLADCNIVVAESSVTRIARLPGIGKQRAVSIPNGIDIAQFSDPPENPHIRQELHIPQEASVVIFTGRLVQLKGLDILVKAIGHLARELPQLYCIIAGTGPEQRTLERIIQTHHLHGRVLLVGFRKDIAALLAASDIFVLPSYREGLPLSLLEAMAARKAVITTPVAGIRGLVVDGENGRLVKPGDAVGLANTIRDLVEHPAQRVSLGQGAHQAMRERHNIDRMAARYDRLYRTWVSHSRRRSRSSRASPPDLTSL